MISAQMQPSPFPKACMSMSVTIDTRSLLLQGRLHPDLMGHSLTLNTNLSICLLICLAERKKTDFWGVFLDTFIYSRVDGETGCGNDVRWTQTATGAHTTRCVSASILTTRPWLHNY